MLDYISESKNGTVDNEKNRKFLEQYGLNPDDFLPKSSPKVTLFIDLSFRVCVCVISRLFWMPRLILCVCLYVLSTDKEKKRARQCRNGKRYAIRGAKASTGDAQIASGLRFFCSFTLTWITEMNYTSYFGIGIITSSFRYSKIWLIFYFFRFSITDWIV